jgi:tetratricopeptide (TPR) repeat protein
MGEGRLAVEDTQRALKLSPLDPRRYYYESLAGTACLAAGDYSQALRHAHRSLRANRMHTSTLRVIAISQWRLGLLEDARTTVRRLLQIEPTLTISRYLDRSPAAPFKTGRDWSDALHHAGVPN